MPGGARAASVGSGRRRRSGRRPCRHDTQPRGCMSTVYDAPVRLTAWEEERLLLFSAAELARRRRSGGLALNAPEAIAVICDAMLEAARAGASLAEVEAAGRAAVGPGDVLDGVRELVDEVRLEVLAGDGTRLVVLVDPLGDGAPLAPDGPGAVIPAAGDRQPIERERRRIVVRN